MQPPDIQRSSLWTVVQLMSQSKACTCRERSILCTFVQRISQSKACTCRERSILCTFVQRISQSKACTCREIQEFKQAELERSQERAEQRRQDKAQAVYTCKMEAKAQVSEASPGTSSAVTAIDLIATHAARCTAIAWLEKLLKVSRHDT